MARFSKILRFSAIAMLYLIVLATSTNAEIRSRASGPSPFKPGCDQSSSQKINYENAEVESWLAVDPNDPDHFIGIWQQDRWHGPGAHGLMTGVSRDGGRTWKRTFAHFSRCSGGTPDNGADYERVSDPWITISPNGTIYESGLPFNTSDARQAMSVSRSTDGGNTWSNPTTLILDTDPTISNDKDSITADPHNSRFAYATWVRLKFTDATQNVLAKGPNLLSRTTNGGASWEPPRVIYDPPQGFATNGSEIVILPDGTLVDFFYLYNNSFSFLVIIRSHDKGVHWSQPILVDLSEDIGIADVETGELVRGGIGNIAVDPHSGTLYLVWMDARFSGGLRDGIAFSKSTDGGLSWSAAVQVNQAPKIQAFAPSIAVTKQGRIAIAYYDFRKDTPDPNTLLTNYWRITSDDGGKTWHEIPLGPPFDMRTAPITGLGYMVTDYEGLAPFEESFASLFVRTNSGNTSNRTDVFAISTDAEGDTSSNGHVEINPHPLTTMEQMLLRRRVPHRTLP